MPRPEPSRPVGVWFCLLLLIAGHAVYHAWWLREDTRPPAWDESHHMLIALDYKRALEGGDVDRLFRPSFMNYPPLAHLSFAPLLPAPSTPEAAADRVAWANLFYLALLILAVYGIGATLFSPGAGFLAALLISFAPSVLLLARRPLLDLPLTAWVAAAFFCLIKADDFRSTRWSLALGIVSGLGLLTKWPFVIYVGLPILWSVLAAARERRWSGPALFVLCLLFVAGPWYLANGLRSVVRIKQLSDLKEARDPDRLTWEGATWYLRDLTDNHLLWPLVAPAAIGLLAGVFSRRWVLVFWFLAPLAVFSSIQNKDTRYLVPALPALSLLSAGVFDGWRAAFFPRAWGLLWGGLAIFLGLAFGMGGHWPLAVLKKAATLGLTPWRERYFARTLESLRQDFATKVEWETDAILKRLAVPPAEGGDGTRVQIVSNHPAFHTWLFRLGAELSGLKDTRVAAPRRRLGEFTDYILWKKGDMGPAFTLGYLQEAAGLLETPPVWLEKTFARVEEWPLPDGSSAVLFERRVQDAPWPSGLGSVELVLDNFPLPRFDAQGLRVVLEPADAVGARKGRFRRIVIQCRELLYRGLVLENVRLEARDVQINLPKLLQDKEIYFLDVGDIRPDATVRADTLVAYLQQKARWLKNPQVTLDGGLRVQGRAGPGAVAAEAAVALSPDKKAVTLALDRLSWGGVPLPLFLARSTVRKNFSLEENNDVPFPVKVDSIVLRDGALTVTAAKN